MTSFGEGRLRLVSLALVLAAVVLCTRPGDAAGAEGERFATLEEAIEAGALEPEVVEADRVGRALEGFVVLAETGPDERSSAEAKAELADRQAGFAVIRDYEHLPLTFVRFDDRRAVLDVLNDPLVAGIGANRVLRPHLTESLRLVRADQVRVLRGFMGDGASVAVLDSGVDFTLAEFGHCTSPGVPAGCLVPVARDFAPEDHARDATGHGTNVAGIVHGVAPKARILALDVFDGGTADVTDIVDAIDFVTANQARFDIRALNMSLGTESFNVAACGAVSNPVLASITAARNAGVLPVASAGNAAKTSFTAGIAWPACTPGVVSVGAVYDSNLGRMAWTDCRDETTAADRVVCFSQSGQPLTMLAPGSVLDAAGQTMSGTSMAAPHVAGAAAVLAEVAPGATVAQVTAALSVGPQIVDPRNQLSRPRLDLEASVQFFHCHGAQVTIRGTNGDDRLVGTPGSDVISGLGGDDVIEGLGGRDHVCGGDGQDRLDGGVGADAVVGDDGDDVLRSGDYQCESSPGVYCFYPIGDEPTSDQLIGGPGFDAADYADRSWPVEITIDGLANDGWPGERDNVHLDVEAVSGGSGDDRLVGSARPEHLSAGAGDDVVRGGSWIDVVACGPGTDRTEQDQWDLRLDCELFLP